MTQRQAPLSPHLGIYRLPLGAWLSIGHRMTGAFLYIGLLLFVAWLVDHLYNGFRPACPYWGLFLTIPGLMLLVAWSFSLFYHLCNGVRHLVWDAGYGFALRAVAWSHAIVLVSSVTMTALVWWLILCGMVAGRS